MYRIVDLFLNFLPALSDLRKEVPVFSRMKCAHFSPPEITFYFTNSSDLPPS